MRNSAAGALHRASWPERQIVSRSALRFITTFNLHDLPDAIRSTIEAVKFGELDIQIEDFAEKGTAGLRLKGPRKGMKRAR